MNVLVADDDRIAAAVRAQTLGRWEFDVTVVADGVEAWRHLEVELERIGREGRISEAPSALSVLEGAVAHLMPEIERATLA
jgi:CheY-like chemotaxis protein